MRHTASVTKHIPSKASPVEDFVCFSATTVASIVAAKGGVSPIFDYLDEKCAIPVEGE